MGAVEMGPSLRSPPLPPCSHHAVCAVVPPLLTHSQRRERRRRRMGHSFILFGKASEWGPPFPPPPLSMGRARAWGRRGGGGNPPLSLAPSAVRTPIPSSTESDRDDDSSLSWRGRPWMSSPFFSFWAPGRPRSSPLNGAAKRGDSRLVRRSMKGRRRKEARHVGGGRVSEKV